MAKAKQQGDSLPLKKEIKAKYSHAKRIFNKHLKATGAKMPLENSAKGYWLATLLLNQGEWVHKNYISQVVRKYIKSAAPDQQVRHLKRDGWNLESKSGYHRISDPTKTPEGFSYELQKQKVLLTSSDFGEIKKAFGNRCASCGAKQGEVDLRYREQKIQLQKAHMDPRKPIAKGNIIPQCQYCNRAYLNDFTFDKKGRVRAVASVEPVRRASAYVKKLILQFLNEKK